MTIPEDFAAQIVLAVRSHPKLGRGTCSSTDECLSDVELIEMLEDSEKDFVTVEAAVAYVEWNEELYQEKVADIRAEIF